MDGFRFNYYSVISQLSLFNEMCYVYFQHCLLTADKASFRYPTIEEIFSHSIIIVTLATCLELVQLGLPDGI